MKGGERQRKGFLFAQIRAKLVGCFRVGGSEEASNLHFLLLKVKLKGHLNTRVRVKSERKRKSILRCLDT